MRKSALLSLFGVCFVFSVFGQNKIEFKEFTLDNGLHVILHQDNTTPIVATSVLYHVGSKNENPERTGFAHFFEHLMFEGSENIPRGKFFEIVESAGGTLNAGTSQDYTIYYEILPSNQLELSLYLESERMLQAKVDQVGVDTQREVIKQEMKEVMEERPYGSFQKEIPVRLYPNHPYKSPIIGSAEHLEASKLEEFMEFYATYYKPNNATLSIAGDIDYAETERLVRAYFEEIPKGTIEPYRPNIEIQKLSNEIEDVVYDNIQLPAIFQGYLMPKKDHPDTYALDLLSTYLLSGKSSLMYKELVDKSQKAIQAVAFPNDLEDGGMFLVLAIANMGVDVDDLNVAIDEVLDQVKTNGIDKNDLQKLINIKENQIINGFGSVANISQSLAQGHVFYGNADYVNTQLDLFRKVTAEDVKRVAQKYLDKDSRVVLKYLPKPTDATE
ncbi:putative Zn-dependent peptidase [Belliella baltica DSM 15883]|uniref:Putative Zn-dependent peptidase n=1 Tax=Belliella baltica (strain DSM 15883 / CIP 108006 / LMG 21964 / BA134) TaxID=866536 RepID=I3Z582_BELBD|nr:pitrilysin family protein [Belliella baltica]AFL84400.1 putative Zn-dependent peptidase [Belliella baltica DSM 15883]